MPYKFYILKMPLTNARLRPNKPEKKLISYDGKR